MSRGERHLNVKISKKAEETPAPEYPKLSDLTFGEAFKMHADYFLIYSLFALLTGEFALCSSFVAIYLIIIWFFQAGRRKSLKRCFEKAQEEYIKELFLAIKESFGWEYDEKDSDKQVKVYPQYDEEGRFVTADISRYEPNSNIPWVLYKPTEGLKEKMAYLVDSYNTKKSNLEYRLRKSYAYTVDLEIWIAFLGFIGLLNIQLR